MTAQCLLPSASEHLIFKQTGLPSLLHSTSADALARGDVNTQVFCPDEMFGSSLLAFSVSFFCCEPRIRSWGISEDL